MKKGADAPASPTQTTHLSLMPTRQTVSRLALAGHIAPEAA